MPPKRITVERASAPRRSAPKGYFKTTYDALTAEENKSVVRSIAMFGTAVAILYSSWGEILLPPQ